MGGCIQPAAECADEQHPEIVAHHRRAGDKSGDDAKGGPALQGETATAQTCIEPKPTACAANQIPFFRHQKRSRRDGVWWPPSPRRSIARQSGLMTRAIRRYRD